MIRIKHQRRFLHDRFSLWSAKYSSQAIQNLCLPANKRRHTHQRGMPSTKHKSSLDVFHHQALEAEISYSSTWSGSTSALGTHEIAVLTPSSKRCRIPQLSQNPRNPVTKSCVSIFHYAYEEFTIRIRRVICRLVRRISELGRCYSRLCSGSNNNAITTLSYVGSRCIFSLSAISRALFVRMRQSRLRPEFVSRSCTSRGCSENLAPHAMTVANNAGCKGPRVASGTGPGRR